MGRKSSHPVQKRKTAIPGQGKPQDSALKLMFRSNENFAEVFNRTVTRKIPISPELLRSRDTDEASLVSVRDGKHLLLQQFRDIIKGVEDPRTQMTLILLGIENQIYIDYAMPYRVLEMELLNYGRQISIIREENKKQMHSAKDKVALSPGEFLGKFRKTDKIAPVICLVLYYGMEVWDGPLSMADMFVESPWADLAAPYPIYLLDVRRMSEEALLEYSDTLRPFFGFLKYESTTQLKDFIEMNKKQFSDLPASTLHALSEITKSKELKTVENQYPTETGGVNMCLGIQLMIDEGRKEGWQEGRKEGVKEGVKEGRQEGIKEGLDQGVGLGEQRKAKEMARKMLQAKEAGEKITLYTGLARNEVEQLAQELHVKVSWSV